MSKANVKGNFKAKLKESSRRFIVNLKRNPQNIPLVVMLLAFVVYSFNLTNVSDTTAQLQSAHMGLCQFCIMLFSILSMVCLLNAFPRRKPANLPILVVFFGMVALLITCAIFYQLGINGRLNDPNFNIDLKKYEFISKTIVTLYVYMAFVILTGVLVATLPVYSKMLKKIDTSVTIEENDAMGEIEITD